MDVGKTTAFDDDRKNPIRKGHGPVQGNTTHTRTYRNRGLAPDPQIDGNQLYTNNFDSDPRGSEVNSHINKTTHDVTYKGHWLPEGQPVPFEEMAPKKKGSMKKKTEYKKKYKKPGYNKLKFQTTNPRGTNYSNRFAHKPRIHNIDTMYAKDYKVHQQRVMAALNTMKK
jgi:hypothetical protein